MHDGVSKLFGTKWLRAKVIRSLRAQRPSSFYARTYFQTIEALNNKEISAVFFLVLFFHPCSLYFSRTAISRRIFVTIVELLSWRKEEFKRNPSSQLFRYAVVNAFPDSSRLPSLSFFSPRPSVIVPFWFYLCRFFFFFWELSTGPAVNCGGDPLPQSMRRTDLALSIIPHSYLCPTTPENANRRTADKKKRYPRVETRKKREKKRRNRW